MNLCTRKQFSSYHPKTQLLVCLEDYLELVGLADKLSLGILRTVDASHGRLHGFLSVRHKLRCGFNGHAFHHDVLIHVLWKLYVQRNYLSSIALSEHYLNKQCAELSVQMCLLVPYFAHNQHLRLNQSVCFAQVAFATQALYRNVIVLHIRFLVVYQNSMMLHGVHQTCAGKLLASGIDG